MRKPTQSLLIFLQALLIALATHSQNQAAPAQWPRFRGPNGSGIADDAHPPVQFGPQTNQLWKVSVPFGLSSPVVWEDRLFLTGQAEKQLVTLAYDTRKGTELWRRTAPAEKLESSHSFSSPAASTPCTDGERVYSYFGSYGVVAYDFAGHEVWRRPFDQLPSQYGTATSPILAGGQLILQRDGDTTNSQVIALSPKTGKTLWESARPLAQSCYSTPVTWSHDGVEELILQGRGRVTAYPLQGGAPKWWVRGWGFSSVTTPVAGDGLLFTGGAGLGDPSEPDDPIFDWKKLIAAYDANKDGKLALAEIPETLLWHIRKEVPKEVPGNSVPLRNIAEWYIDSDKDKIITKAEWDASDAEVKDKFNADRFVAIRPGGREDSTTTHVQWETTKGLSEMPSALYYRGRLYFIRDGGMWTVLEPKTGRRLLDRERLPIKGQFVASPIAANGYIYVVNEPGAVAVLRAGDTIDVAAVNPLGENVRATPAIAGNALYVRTTQSLWAFGQ